MGARESRASIAVTRREGQAAFPIGDAALPLQRNPRKRTMQLQRHRLTTAEDRPWMASGARPARLGDAAEPPGQHKHAQAVLNYLGRRITNP